MLRNHIKNLYESSDVGYNLINPILRIYEYFSYHLGSDNKVLRKAYKKVFGMEPNLENPKTLNEKINWLKLYDRTSLHTQCSDKYVVRSYVKNKIGEQYLVPLYFKTDKPEDIVPKNLPNFPYVIKSNHDSGGVFLVFDYEKFDYKKTQRLLKRSLKHNYYWVSREWQYKNITPCIIVEKLLLNSKGKIPIDYKLHCFNGNCRMIQVDIGRGTENHHRNWYDTKWTREPYSWSSPKGDGKFTDPSDTDVPEPKTLHKMITLSNKLAESFDYVRVDWYDVEGELYFGELTFHHDGGLRPIIPKEWDFKLGSELKLVLSKNAVI